MPVVAVVGASTNRDKYGNKALRAFVARGYTVVPVNPREREVEGLRAYRSVLEYPGSIDEATLYVPPAVGLLVLDELAQKGVRSVWLNPGADAPDVVARAKDLGLNVIVACSILDIGEMPSA